jgi:hypothetical protein
MDDAYFIGETVTQDPVQQIVFSFVDDQLFRLTINYERRFTEAADGRRSDPGVVRTLRSPVTPSRQTRASSTFVDRRRSSRPRLSRSGPMATSSSPCPAAHSPERIGSS